MEAIETVYRGFRFRSRTEARWAVFLDNLRCAWEYEKEGFELPPGRYLPDFWLPFATNSFCYKDGGAYGNWIEIKGESPSASELLSLSELALSTGHTAKLFVGSPWNGKSYTANYRDGLVRTSAFAGFYDETDPERDMLIDLAASFGRFSPLAESDLLDIEQIRKAVLSARGARFEFADSMAQTL